MITSRKALFLRPSAALVVDFTGFSGCKGTAEANTLGPTNVTCEGWPASLVMRFFRHMQHGVMAAGRAKPVEMPRLRCNTCEVKQM